MLAGFRMWPRWPEQQTVHSSRDSAHLEGEGVHRARHDVQQLAPGALSRRAPCHLPAHRGAHNPAMTDADRMSGFLLMALPCLAGMHAQLWRDALMCDTDARPSVVLSPEGCRIGL